MLFCFVSYSVAANDASKILSGLEETLESHLIVFAGALPFVLAFTFFLDYADILFS